MTVSLPRGLIVSCQALPDEPLFGASHMAAMARAALMGGAVAIRANGSADIAAIRAAIDLPIIGLFKEDISGCEVRITPTLAHADQVASAGADIIAFDATWRARPGNLTVKALIDHIHIKLNKLALADVSTIGEGQEAFNAGADFIATTLSGYTAYSPALPSPDFVLLERLVKQLNLPVLAEGRISTPEQAARALELGAHAVVVGGAITRPQWITAQFANALKGLQS
jgi:N-acylglucosamine-6-phosphate 2-epimerase